MCELAKDTGEIGAPAVAHDEMRAMELEAGDEAGILLEGDRGIGAEGLPDKLAVAFLLGRRQRRGADRFERDAVRRHGLAHRLRQGFDLLDEPVQKDGPDRRPVETGSQTLGDLDRQPARPLGPGRVDARFLLLDGRLCDGLEGRRLLRHFCQTRRPRLLGGGVGRGQDRVAFPRKADACPLDLGEGGGRLAALRLCPGQHPLRRGPALLDHGGDRAPENRPSSQTRMTTLTACMPSVHQSMVMASFQQRVGEEQEKRNHQAVDGHGLDHRQPDEQRARYDIRRFGLAGDSVLAAATARPSASAGPIAPKETARAAEMMLTRANQFMGASFGWRYPRRAALR